MKKKSPAEMRRAHVTKVARTVIRLKHSLRADEELNDFLPDTLAEFDDALARGELKELRASIDDVLGSAGAPRE